MSLIPSESASFPDLIGQRHGYGKPTPPRASSRQKPAGSPTSPTPPENRENNHVVLEPLTPLDSPAPSENFEGDCGVLKTSPPPSSPPPFRNPEDNWVELEPLTPLSSPPESPEQNSGVPTDPAPSVSPPPPQRPEENPAGLQSEDELRLPASSSETAKPTSGPIGTPAENSRLGRAALPVPPQRSPAQMRSKIQTQEIASPNPPARPRTPVRGLAMSRPAATLFDKPADTKASAFSLLNLPRARVIKLLRFVVCEMIVVGVLILAMAFGFSARSTDDPLSLFLKILAVVAAVAAVVVPVIFYGLPETLPRNER